MIAGRLDVAWRGLSLRGQLTAATVGLLAAFMWTLALLSATVLEDRLEDLLAAQQFAFTRQAAADIDAKLRDRIDALARAAAELPADLSYASIQPYLAQRLLMRQMFGGGIAVIGLDGTALADYPVAEGRRGGWFGDRDYFRQVLATRRPYVDKPIVGRALKRPVLVIAVPVFDRQGRLRAVMTGITAMDAPNFLGIVSDPARTGANEYYLVSVRDRMFVATGDGKRALTSTSKRGTNATLDRMLDGFEGSLVGVNSQGISKLYSGKRIPSADWLLMAALPVDVAFAPARAMQQALFATAAVLTLLAIYAVGRMVRGMLSPLDAAGNAMRRMTGGQAPLAPLPVVRDDEVGQLIANFNRLVHDRRDYEQRLMESEQRFRQLVEAAPDAIFVQIGGRFAYVNEAAAALFGAGEKNPLLGLPILERVHPDCRAEVSRRIRQVNEEKTCGPTTDLVYLRLDGTAISVEVSAAPFRYGDEDGALVFMRDIRARKAFEHERELQSKRIVELSHKLVATQEEERRRLSTALHDRSSPNLAALAIMLRSMARAFPDDEEAAMLVDDARALLDDTTAGIREICAELRPPLLDYAGLLSALQAYAESFSRRVGIRVNVQCLSPGIQAAPDIESALFRVAQEAMTNGAKHARATRVDVILGEKDGRATLVVADDGAGFDPAQLSAAGGRPGLGLLAMQERVEFAGGTCEIRSRPGQGTRISVTMPLQPCRGDPARRPAAD